MPRPVGSTFMFKKKILKVVKADDSRCKGCFFFKLPIKESCDNKKVMELAGGCIGSNYTVVFKETQQ